MRWFRKHKGLREIAERLHKEVMDLDDYRKEQASAKLLSFFESYERLVKLYAEIRIHQPKTKSLESILPFLAECSAQVKSDWQQIIANK